MALKPEERIDESTGDLLFSSTAPLFRTDLLLSRDITSRTYSFYYPRTRPQASAAVPDRVEHQRPLRGLGRARRRRLRGQQTGPDRNDARRRSKNTCRDIRERVDHVEAVDAQDFRALHASTSQGPVSAPSSRAWRSAARCPSRFDGLYHAGSVGIIMSGWLGAMNYGVIVANEVENHLHGMRAAMAATHGYRAGRRDDVGHDWPRTDRAADPASRTIPAARRDRRVQPRSDRVSQDSSAATNGFIAATIPIIPSLPASCCARPRCRRGRLCWPPHHLDDASDGRVPVATRSDKVQFKRMVRPGDSVLIEVELQEQLASAFFLSGRVRLDGKVAVRLDFGCTLTTPPGP